MSNKEMFIKKLDEEQGIKLNDEDLMEVNGGMELGGRVCTKCGGTDFKVFTLYGGPNKNSYKAFCKNCYRMLDISDEEVEKYMPEE